MQPLREVKPTKLAGYLPPSLGPRKVALTMGQMPAAEVRQLPGYLPRIAYGAERESAHGKI